LRASASNDVEGMMLSWTLGGYPSPNLEIAARLCEKSTPTIDDVLNAVAKERYGTDGAPLARKAWSAFSAAFREFPYKRDVLYANPMQMGPANPLYLKPTRYHATMVGIPYDDLHAWRGIYPSAIFVSQFEKVADGWRSGIPNLKAAVEKSPADHKDDVQSELRFAQTALNHFQSTANQAKFVMARDQLAASLSQSQKLSAKETERLRGEIRKILESEIELARDEFRLTQSDSRIGFEASNQYVYVPFDLAEKIINCRWLLEQL
jgi:hypothetical protein